jgi:hypothetical protein
MCPDHQLLSVYLDGELPSPWKEKLENHLERCPRCRERLEAWRNISRLPGEAPGPAAAADGAVDGAKERVWLKLQAATDGAVDGAFPRSSGIWRRSVSVPFPLAAAAAAVLFIVLGAMVFRQVFFAAPVPDGAMAAGVDLDLHNIAPVSDMSGVLQYLGSQDTGDIVILRLPDSKNFMSSGEPRIIRAAELPAKFPRGFPAPVPADSGGTDYSAGGNEPR